MNTIPTSHVVPHPTIDQAFFAEGIISPINCEGKGLWPDVTVRFDEEPDIIAKWSPNKTDHWDSCVCEVIAVMELVCIRADHIWNNKKIADKDKHPEFTKVLIQLGFAITA